MNEFVATALRRRNQSSHRLTRFFRMGWPALVALLLFGCARASTMSRADATPCAQEIGSEEDWGIEVVSIEQTAAGHMLDFRYRVTDPEKAAAVFDRKNKAYLIDQATGAALPVPRTAKVGPLRQTNFEPDSRRVYFILFNNGGGLVKPGGKVTLMVGDRRLENLVVR